MAINIKGEVKPCYFPMGFSKTTKKHKTVESNLMNM